MVYRPTPGRREAKGRRHAGTPVSAAAEPSITWNRARRMRPRRAWCVQLTDGQVSGIALAKRPPRKKVRLDFTSVYNNSDRFYKTREDRPQASVQARHRHNVESTREASRTRAWRRIDASAAQRRCGSSLECRSRTSHPCLGYHTILPYPLRQRDSTGRCVRENERRCTRR